MPRYRKPVENLLPEHKQLVGTSIDPDVKGRKKYGPLDWSLDDLIRYRYNGTPPARIPDADLVYKMGSIGVSLSNVAAIFDLSLEKFSSNQDWYESWARGRAECGAKVRASIVDDALEKDILMAKIHLDKVLSGDKIGDNTYVQVNVSNNNLDQVSTDELLNVAFKEKDEDSSNQ
jgi:hypothetical protein